MKFDVVIATLEYVKDGSLRRVSKSDGHRKGRLKALSYVRMYTYLMCPCEMTGAK